MGLKAKISTCVTPLTGEFLQPQVPETGQPNRTGLFFAVNLSICKLLSPSLRAAVGHQPAKDAAWEAGKAEGS